MSVCRSLKLLLAFGVLNCPSLLPCHFLCAPVGLPDLLQSPSSVEVSKLMAGGRRQSTQRGPLNYASIAFEGLGSFRDYVNKEISTIREKSKISDPKIFGHWSIQMPHCGDFPESMKSSAESNQHFPQYENCHTHFQFANR